MHRRFLAAAFAAVVLAAAAVPVASAVEPTRADRVESGSYVVDWMCPFPVVSGYEIDWHEIDFYNQDGDRVRQGQQLFEQDWISANGKTAVSERQVINATVLFGPDGGDTYIIWRVSPARYHLPGGGVYKAIGAGVWAYDYTTGEFKATPGVAKQSDDAKILCDALAP
jgi:hypothetical protein